MLGYEFLEIVLKRKNSNFDKKFDYFIKSLNNHKCTLNNLYKYANLYKVTVSIDFISFNSSELLLGSHLKNLLIRKNLSLKNTAIHLNINYVSLVNRLKRLNNNSFNLKELLFITSSNNFQTFLIISNKLSSIKINLENKKLGNEMIQYLKENNYDLNKIKKYHFLSQNGFLNLITKMNNKNITYNTLINFLKFDKNLSVKIDILNFYNNNYDSLDKKFKIATNLISNNTIAEKLDISSSQVSNFLKNLSQNRIQLNKLFFYADKLNIKIKIKFQ